MLLFLLACLTSAEDYEDLLARAQDADGDGFRGQAHGGTDCDDGSAAVFPGAAELCDGLDNDCDAGVDENVSDAQVFFRDDDGDGFGDSDQARTACVNPEGFVSSGEDCDDTDPARNPGAAEICDGIDNDCDALVDDQDADLELGSGQAWYPDADGDGYGDAQAEAVVACSAPDALLKDASDCDDADRNINPNATEICRDGVDNDCSGDAPECLLRGGFQLENPDLVFDGLAGSMAVVDSDADGVSELVFGVPAGNGAVYLFEDVGDGDVLGTAQADWSQLSSAAGTGFALSVMALPDLDGDGGGELAVGARGADEVLLLASDGLGFESTPAAVLYGYSEGQQFGDVVRPVGALGAEGSNSLVVGAPGVKGSDQGSLYFWFDLALEDTHADSADLVIYDRVVPRFGAAKRVSSGDVNGDGRDDLVYGVTARSMGFLNFGPFVSGESIQSDDSDTLLLNHASGSQMAQATAIGDLTGDGYADLLVGEPGYADGAVHLFEGGSAWSAQVRGSDAEARLEAEEGQEGLGDLIHLADLDDNGVADLVVASSRGDGEGYLFYGPLGARSSTEDADAYFTGVPDAGCFSSVALLDINDDGAADLVVNCEAQGLRTLAILGQGM